MNIVSQEWDSNLCDFFQIPMNILPKIKSCSEIYGYVFTGCLTGIPISGVGGFLFEKHIELVLNWTDRTYYYVPYYLLFKIFFSF